VTGITAWYLVTVSPYLQDKDGVTALDIIQVDPQGNWAGAEQKEAANQIIHYYRHVSENRPGGASHGEL